jgi:DNA-binding NtrC family response regulator
LDDLYRKLGVRNVLLIGNDPWIRETLSFFFQIRGCRFVSATSGRESIAALSSGRFDLILCEDLLPDGDSVSLLNLHEDRQPGAIRLLIAQSPYQPEIEEAVRSGFQGVIPKPFQIEALEDALKRIPARGREQASVE